MSETAILEALPGTTGAERAGLHLSARGCNGWSVPRLRQASRTNGLGAVVDPDNTRQSPCRHSFHSGRPQRRHATS